jgi:putative transposase
MKRRPSFTDARFLTFSCYRCLQLMGNPLIRDHFAKCLERGHQKFGFIIIAWVAMPEHAHLMIRPAPGENDIVEPLAWLKRECAKEVIARWRLMTAPILKKITDKDGKPHFWQHGGGHDRNIWSHKEMTEKVGYIHKNPVTRGLVQKADDWEWSSARWYNGRRDGIVVVDRTAWEVPRPPPSRTAAPREEGIEGEGRP